MISKPIVVGNVYVNKDDQIMSVVMAGESRERLKSTSENIHKQYYKSSLEYSSHLDVLKKTVEKVIKKNFSFNEKIGISVLSREGNKIHLVVYGPPLVFLWRRNLNEIVKIISGKTNKITFATGVLLEEDLLLVGTSSFFEKLHKEDIKAILKQDDLSIVGPSLSKKVVFNNSSDSGLAIISSDELVTSPGQGIKFNSRLSIKLRIAGVLEKIIKVLPSRGIRVRVEPENFDRSRRSHVAVFAGVVLLVLLSVSIIFGIRQRGLVLMKGKYEEELKEARINFEQADLIFSLNPQQARQKLENARRIALGLEKEGVSDPELDALINNIEEKVGSVLGEYSGISDLFLDLSLVSEGFSVDEVVVAGEEMFILDLQQEKLVKVAIKTKRTDVLAGSQEISGSSSLAAYTGQTFLMKEDGVIKVGRDTELVIKADWEGEMMITAYAGNLYLLDRSKSVIWRYSGINGGFAQKQNWFGPGVEPDLSGVISWVIDGSIWILTGNGEVQKYSLGRQDRFILSDLEPSLANPASIYTNEELKYLYLLDPDSSRVLVFDKQGSFKAQYFDEEINESTNLVVSEEQGKIIFSRNDKLYSIEIKHLD